MTTPTWEARARALLERAASYLERLGYTAESGVYRAFLSEAPEASRWDALARKVMELEATVLGDHDPLSQDIRTLLDEASEKCKRCGQSDHGQTGEYPCSDCGLPSVWDDPSEASGDVPQDVEHDCGEDTCVCEEEKRDEG